MNEVPWTRRACCSALDSLCLCWPPAHFIRRPAPASSSPTNALRAGHCQNCAGKYYSVLRNIALLCCCAKLPPKSCWWHQIYCSSWRNKSITIMFAVIPLIHTQYPRSKISAKYGLTLAMYLLVPVSEPIICSEHRAQHSAQLMVLMALINQTTCMLYVVCNTIQPRTLGWLLFFFRANKHWG